MNQDVRNQLEVLKARMIAIAKGEVEAVDRGEIARIRVAIGELLKEN